MTFGIPQDILPFTSNGKLKLSNHKAFLEQQRNREQRTVESKMQDQREGISPSLAVERVIVPSNVDILLGRGSQYQSHPGNARFHHIIQEYIDFYNQGDKFDKTVLAELVLSVVKHGGGSKHKTKEPSPERTSPIENFAAKTIPAPKVPGKLDDEGIQLPPAPTLPASKNPIMVAPPPSARFLLRDEAGWMVVSDDIARNRVSRAFRNRRIATGTRSPGISSSLGGGGTTGVATSQYAHHRVQRSTPPSIQSYSNAFFDDNTATGEYEQYQGHHVGSPGMPSVASAPNIFYYGSGGSSRRMLEDDGLHSHDEDQQQKKRQKF